MWRAALWALERGAIDIEYRQSGQAVPAFEVTQGDIVVVKRREDQAEVSMAVDFVGKYGTVYAVVRRVREGVPSPRHVVYVGQEYKFGMGFVFRVERL